MRTYISYAEVDELCDSLIRQYVGKNGSIPQCVDIDGFVRDFLKCTIIYETFAEDDHDKIGFTADGHTPLKIKKNDRILKAVYPKNTIVLEQYLLNNTENGRRRFTLGHEAGHILAGKISPDNTACFHRVYDTERSYTVDEIKERYSIGEWQANAISASLLMPRFMILDALERFNNGRLIRVYGESVFHPREKVILRKIADSLCVSFTALVIRLRGLKLFDYHDIFEYIENELQLGGDFT